MTIRTMLKYVTDVEQSLKLKEILGHKGYDCFYWRMKKESDFTLDHRTSRGIDDELFSYRGGYETPAWTFSALLNLLPGFILSKDGDEKDENHKYRFFTTGVWSEFFDEPIDAAMDLIVKLHEKGIL